MTAATDLCTMSQACQGDKRLNGSLLERISRHHHQTIGYDVSCCWAEELMWCERGDSNPHALAGTRS